MLLEGLVEFRIDGESRLDSKAVRWTGDSVMSDLAEKTNSRRMQAAFNSSVQHLESISVTEDAAALTPLRVDIDRIAETILGELSAFAEAKAAQDQIASLGQRLWVNEGERRFKVATIFAQTLLDIASADAGDDNVPRVHLDREKLMHAVRGAPTARIVDAIASVLLAPESEFREVVQRYGDDSGMVSALFAMPRFAARLRLQIATREC